MIGDVWEIRTFACFPLFLDSANCGEQVNSHGFRTMGTTLRTYFGRQPCAKLAPTVPHFGPKPDQLQNGDRGRALYKPGTTLRIFLGFQSRGNLALKNYANLRVSHAFLVM